MIGKRLNFQGKELLNFGVGNWFFGLTLHRFYQGKVPNFDEFERPNYWHHEQRVEAFLAWPVTL